MGVVPALVDKPGRRKKRKTPWGKISAVVVIALIVLASGYYVYETYIYKPPPVFAEVGTSLGNFYIELYPACAPQTVANFVKLSQAGFYNDLVWHRIVPGFVIQTGDPNSRGGTNSSRGTWGQGGSNSSIPFETCDWLHNYAGYLGMASTAAKAAGTSQFYINLSNSSSNLGLDGNYTVFAKVISGMSVVCAISHVPTYTSKYATQPVNPVFLDNITVIGQANAPAVQTLNAPAVQTLKSC